MTGQPNGIDATIAELTASLQPVRKLAPPWIGVTLWLAAVIVLAAVLYAILGGELDGLIERPWVLPSLIGSAAAAALAAVSAFLLSRPDRADAWMLLPLPAVLLWVVSLVAGCIAGAGDPETWGTTGAEVRACLTIIIGASVPLSALAIVMIRRARPERFARVALLAGLASAAAASTVLILVNPHNSTVLDVAVHTACVAAVVTASALVGGRFLRSA